MTRGLLSERGLHLLSCSVDSSLKTHLLGVGCVMGFSVILRGEVPSLLLPSSSGRPDARHLSGASYKCSDSV